MYSPSESFYVVEPVAVDFQQFFQKLARHTIHSCSTVIYVATASHRRQRRAAPRPVPPNPWEGISGDVIADKSHLFGIGPFAAINP